MNWDAIGAIGEVVGAAGVIVTLGYLAMQIRANTRALRAESRRAVRQGSREANLAIAAEGDLARIFDSGIRDPTTLDSVEKTRFAFALSELINASQEALAEMQRGSGDSNVFEEFVTPALGFLRTPGGRWYWDRYGGGYSDAFQAYVNEHTPLGK